MSAPGRGKRGGRGGRGRGRGGKRTRSKSPGGGSRGDDFDYIPAAGFGSGPAAPIPAAPTWGGKGKINPEYYASPGGEMDATISMARQEVDYKKERAKAYWTNEGPKAVWVGIFVVANITVFLMSYIKFSRSPVYGLLGQGLPWARGAAGMLLLDCGLVLVPMCRTFVSKLRGTWLNEFVPFDKNIVFHKRIAYTIGFATIIHACAHYFNFLRFNNSERERVNELLGTNFLRLPNVNEFAFTTIPGATGHIATLVMVIAYTAARVEVRSKFFEVFWYTHHLFLVFYAALFFHGTARLLGVAPRFWIWVSGPVALYAIERLLRSCRGNSFTEIERVVVHPSDVIELRIHKPGFRYKSGQYLFLNCPYISKYEWHPFTISSAPEEEHLSVHIRQVGDWTKALGSVLTNKKHAFKAFNEAVAQGKPVLKVDGPVGAASQDAFSYPIVVLIGAGIGVTPFASILKSCNYQIDAYRQGMKVNFPVKKVYFFWVCRDTKAFEWFHDLLHTLEDQRVDGFLSINIYMTQVSDAEKARITKYNDDRITKRRTLWLSRKTMPRDQITGLRSPTHFGRPDWPVLFDKMIADHGRSASNPTGDGDIGVFLCGPRALSKAVYAVCRDKTTPADHRHPDTGQPYGARFKFQKENF